MSTLVRSRLNKKIFGLLFNMLAIHYTNVKDEQEKNFLKTVEAYSLRADKQQRNVYTCFYPQDWMMEVITKYIGLQQLPNVRFFGGYASAERKVMGFLIDEEVEEEDLPFTVLKITVKTGIGKDLSHRDFLGAILGLGITRSKIGDILIKPFGAYLIVMKDISEFITWSLTSIGRYTNIMVEEAKFEVLEASLPQVKCIETTVASLRADAVFATAFNLSRTSVSKLIQNDKAKCNGITVTLAAPLKEGDIGSLKGYGKMRLKTVNGKTKKDRLHITIEKYI